VYLAEFVNGNPFTPEDLGDQGLPVVRIRQLLDETADQELAHPPSRAVVIDDGDLIFSWSATLAVRHWHRGRALLNQHLFRVDPRPGVEKRWLGYALEVGIERLKPLMHGSAMTHITIDMLRSLTVALPLPDVQRAIADYLDAETARIDALIDTETRRLELARERLRSAVQAHVLGREDEGVRANDPEGVLQPVPAGWALRRNKTFLREVVDLTATGDEDLLTVSHITGVTPRAEKEVTMFLAESNEGYKRVEPGDLVVNTMWAWMGALGVSDCSGIVSPAYGVYRFTDAKANARYFDALFRSSAYVSEMTRYSKGVWTSRLRLYPDSFLALHSPFPSPAEQHEIAAQVRGLRQETERLSTLLEHSIELLRERRQALIKAAVTGELDIPGAAA
jgi:type I restriction enzyme S subunit